MRNCVQEAERLQEREFGPGGEVKTDLAAYEQPGRLQALLSSPLVPFLKSRTCLYGFRPWEGAEAWDQVFFLRGRLRLWRECRPESILSESTVACQYCSLGLSGKTFSHIFSHDSAASGCSFAIASRT